LLKLAENRPFPESTAGRLNTDWWTTQLKSAAADLANLEAQWSTIK
jgi:hypothetical protein